MIRTFLQDLKNQRIPVLPCHLFQIPAHRYRIQNSKSFLILHHRCQTQPQMILLLAGIIEKIRQRCALFFPVHSPSGIFLHINIKCLFISGQLISERPRKTCFPDSVNRRINDNQTLIISARHLKQACTVVIQAYFHDPGKNLMDGLVFIDRDLLFPHLCSFLTCQHKSSGSSACLPLLVGNLIPDQQKFCFLKLLQSFFLLRSARDALFSSLCIPHPGYSCILI